MMKRLLFLFVFPLLAFGQGTFAPPQTAFGTVNGITRPLPGATITVCAASAGGFPCSPALAGTIFKDAALTQPLTNPFFADVNANYNFAIAPGTYTVTVTALGFTGYSYQLSLSSPGAGAASVSNCVSPNKMALYASSGIVVSCDLNMSDDGAGGLIATNLTDTSLTAGNCVQAAAGGKLTTAGGACGLASGFVTTTGSPAAGNLGCFSGATSITNCNLSGDITTSGGSAATLATVATPGTNTKITFNAKGLVTAGTQALLASADYANQGTTTTVLHGNAAGNPSFGAVALATDVSGTLPGANYAQVNLAASGNGGVGGTLPSANLGASSSNCTGNNFAQGWNSGGTPICAAPSAGVAVDLGARQANIAATPLVTPGANGFYRFTCWTVVTQQATTSAKLPECNVLFTDADSSTAQNLAVTWFSSSTTNPGVGYNGASGDGSTNQALMSTVSFYAKSGVAIQYSTTLYASSGATPMQYAIHIRLEGPF